MITLPIYLPTILTNEGMYLTQRLVSSLKNPQNNDSYALLVIKA
jgi:hypothetical protein